MVRGRVLTRDEHATIRCEWKTKRAAPENDRISDKRLKVQIGAPYGVKERAVNRAIINHSNDNLESDDDHCAICLDEQAFARRRVKREGLDGDDHHNVGFSGYAKESIDLSKPYGGPSGSIPTPTSHDVISVHSSDEEDASVTQAHTSSLQFVPSPNLRSVRKRSYTRARIVSDDSDNNEWSPAAQFAGSSDSQPSKKRRTRHSGVHAEFPKLDQFLRSIDPTYTRHASIFVELGVTNPDQLVRLQPVQSQLRTDFMSRIEQRGVSAFERTLIEDAILKLPG